MKTVNEAAHELGVTKERVYALIKAGQLDARKVGGIWLVDEASLDSRRNSHVNRAGGRPRKGPGPNDVKLLLMNREHMIAETTYDTRHNNFSWVGPLDDRDRAPLGLADERGRISPATLSDWWKSRGIPGTRRGLADILAKNGVTVPEELVYRNLGLSLSDQYWVCPVGSNLAWYDVNFYNNDFGELDVSSADATGGGRHPNNTSDGNLPKHWQIAPNGARARVLLKSGGSLDQEPCNEVIATELCRRILDNADYVPYELDEWRGRLASRCQNFLNDCEEYVPAQYVRMVLRQERHHSEYQHYLECCHALGIERATQAISRQIVCDDIMANTDRHWRNFGVVRNVQTLQCRIAPIFDTGTSLWCDQEDLLAARDFTFRGKQFEENPGRQLQLADLEWVDTSTLAGFDEYAREVLGASKLPPERIGLICEGIRWRTERMTHICAFL